MKAIILYCVFAVLLVGGSLWYTINKSNECEKLGEWLGLDHIIAVKPLWSTKWGLECARIVSPR